MPGSRSAREEILAAVRSALVDAPPVAAPEAASLRSPYDGMVERFVERVTDYRATVERVAADGVADAVARTLSGRSAVVPADLGLDVPGAVVDDGALTWADLDAVAAVVTRARVAIAETGTVVLDHGPGQGRRAISLLPDLHVCIVDAGQVVPDVPEAVARLDARRPHTWISGPSATSDIELDRVEGVHGPRILHVLLVG